jgi:hypothetical protein
MGELKINAKPTSYKILRNNFPHPNLSYTIHSQHCERKKGFSFAFKYFLLYFNPSLWVLPGAPPLLFSCGKSDCL